MCKVQTSGIAIFYKNKLTISIAIIFSFSPVNKASTLNVCNPLICSVLECPHLKFHKLVALRSRQSSTMVMEVGGVERVFQSNIYKDKSKNDQACTQ